MQTTQNSCHPLRWLQCAANSDGIQRAGGLRLTQAQQQGRRSASCEAAHLVRTETGAAVALTAPRGRSLFEPDDYTCSSAPAHASQTQESNQHRPGRVKP